MDDAINLVFLNDSLNFVVILNIGFDSRDIKAVLGEQVSNARFETLIERVVSDYRLPARMNSSAMRVRI